MTGVSQMQRRRFSIRDIERMIEAGIVHEDEPLELLAGELVLMSPQNPRHAALTEKIRRLLEKHCPDDSHTRTHSPLVASDDSLPEPDVALVRGDVDTYLDRHPDGQDALLVVEVAATSQARDRAKADVYSQAGVPIYWLVDLDQSHIEVRSEPQLDGSYGETQVVDGSAHLTLPGSSEVVAASELLA